MAIIDLFLHLDKHLASIFNEYGVWTYAILTLTIFCETGLVVTPFLPGDSLLFAAGAFAADGHLSLPLLLVLLTSAAIIGDAVNYRIGRWLGPKALSKPSRIFRKEYIERTQRFYEKYGGKTIVMARFFPIIRTFAPFLAGVGKMSYTRFALFNVIGAILWMGLFLGGGYFFGTLPLVRRNFSLVIVAILVISALPAIMQFVKEREKAV